MRHFLDIAGRPMRRFKHFFDAPAMLVSAQKMITLRDAVTASAAARRAVVGPCLPKSANICAAAPRDGKRAGRAGDIIAAEVIAGMLRRHFRDDDDVSGRASFRPLAMVTSSTRHFVSRHFGLQEDTMTGACVESRAMIILLCPLEIYDDASCQFSPAIA